MLSGASNPLARVLTLLQVHERTLPSAEYGTTLSLTVAVAASIMLVGNKE